MGNVNYYGEFLLSQRMTTSDEKYKWHQNVSLLYGTRFNFTIEMPLDLTKKNGKAVPFLNIPVTY